MLGSTHARMLAVAPGGWDRCTCRHCRIPGDDGMRRSARTIERRLVAAEIADALDEIAEDGPFATPDIVGTTWVAEYDDETGEGFFTLTVDEGFASAVIEVVPTSPDDWFCTDPFCDICG